MERFARGMVAVILVGACLSCRTAEESPPVSPDRMTGLLVDLHLAHARVEVGGVDSTGYVDSLLALHRVSRDDFRAAMKYYAKHPDIYVSMLDSVIDQMRVMRPSVDEAFQDPLYERPYGSVFRDTLAGLEQ